MPNPISQPANPVERLYTTRQLVRATGATLREVQWWCEHAILHPRRGAVPQRDALKGRGDARLFTAADVRLVRLVRDLRQRGVSLQALRPVLPFLKRYRDGYLMLEVATSIHGIRIYRPTHLKDERAVLRKGVRSADGVLVIDLGGSDAN